MAKAKGKRNRRKEKLEFVQDYLPIRDLKNGIIETTDNRYIKILEIEPINFTLRSDEEQFNIISSFASWLKISPMRLQFKSITRRADSDKHISMICEELEHEENPQCKELGEDYIGLIKDVGNREALTRRFFLIFQYRPKPTRNCFGASSRWWICSNPWICTPASAAFSRRPHCSR